VNLRWTSSAITVTFICSITRSLRRRFHRVVGRSHDPPSTLIVWALNFTLVDDVGVLLNREPLRKR